MMILMLAYLCLAGCAETNNEIPGSVASNATENTIQICFPERCIAAEVADTPELRAQGMMYRESLSEEEGMLFVFDRPAVYHFWMRNTLIPLDMIFLDPHKRIIHIEEKVPPCYEAECEKYGPMEDVLYVVEVNAGYCENNGIESGQTVSFQWPER
ncbi:DUF192 domain-containing protein [Candidatus Woesearchaeota archaeon]|nr:DUF192 domain-containing protein [Candidatus Woesearchaeota archaeon]